MPFKCLFYSTFFLFSFRPHFLTLPISFISFSFSSLSLFPLFICSFLFSFFLLELLMFLSESAVAVAWTSFFKLTFSNSLLRKWFLFSSEELQNSSHPFLLCFKGKVASLLQELLSYFLIDFSSKNVFSEWNCSDQSSLCLLAQLSPLSLYVWSCLKLSVSDFKFQVLHFLGGGRLNANIAGII